MTARWYAAAALLISVLTTGQNAIAWSHIARTGETLEQLAVRYYGDASKEIVIRASNGFVHPDDGRLTEGEQLEIPEVTFYRVTAEETWDTVANRFLASSRRGPFLASINNAEKDAPLVQGTIIKIPYHLRHIFAKGESLKSVAKLYYNGSRGSGWLRRYNNPQKRKYSQGEVVIVPLFKLAFTAEEQRRVDEFRSTRYTENDIAEQKTIVSSITSLKKAYEQGQYVLMVTLASDLIGNGKLTIPQEIGISNYLGYSYVALDEIELAKKSFGRALELQPEMELSPITTSPKILAVFEEVKRAVKKELPTPDKAVPADPPKD